jgi:hypothetical protein
MAFKSYKEYLDNRGKLVSAPSTEEVPDYHGPSPKSPTAGEPQKILGEKGKLNDVKGPKKAKGGGGSYRSGKGGDMKPQTMEPGLVQKGNKAEPHPKQGKPQAEGGKQVSSPWNGKVRGKHPYPADPNKKLTKTEAFINATKDLSLSEFIQYMHAECCDMSDETLPMITAYAPGKFHPHPPEVIKYIAALIKANPRILEMLIHEIKDQDSLSDLLGAAMDHPESYDVLTNLFGDEKEGPSRASALVRSMDDKHKKYLDDNVIESVAPPFGSDDEIDDDSPGVVHGKHHDDAMADQEDEDQPAEDDAQPEEEGGEVPPDEDVPPQDGDEAPEMPADDEGEGEESPEDEPQDQPQGEEDDEEPAPAPAPKRLKKRFAHHHIMDAMSKVDHMRDSMKGMIQ